MTVSGSTVFIYVSALSAVFGIVYLPVLMRQPKAFVSPYARADVRKRVAAASVDGLLVATCAVLYGTQGSMLFIAIGAAYLLLRDALFIPGQSVGKFLFGLRVISLASGRPCGRSIRIFPSKFPRRGPSVPRPRMLTSCSRSCSPG